MGMGDTQHDSANTARLIGHLRRCRRRHLHGVEMATVSDAVYVFRQLIVDGHQDQRSEEHTSELQSLMRISYAVFCLKKKLTTHSHSTTTFHYHAQYTHNPNTHHKS